MSAVEAKGMKINRNIDTSVSIETVLGHCQEPQFCHRGQRRDHLLSGVGGEVRESGKGLDSLLGEQRKKLTKDKGWAVRTRGPAEAETMNCQWPQYTWLSC